MRPIVKEIEKVYGAANREAQNERYRAAEVKFAEHFGKLGEHRFFSVPGRTEICGNHTEKNNGKSFAASVTADVIAVVEPTDDGFVTIKSEGFDEDKISLSELEPRDDEKNTSAALIRGVLKGFTKNRHSIGGFRAYTTSAVKKGSGLASSAAFAVLVGTIISHLFNDGEISPVRIAQAAQLAENEYFGRASGLLDHLACSVGGFVAVDFKDDNIPVVEGVRYDMANSEHALCIINTVGEKQDHSAEYAAIAEEMREVASFFDCRTLRSLSLPDIMLNIGVLRKAVGDRAVLRAIHFFNENERVDKIVHALKNDDFENFLYSVRESGDSSFKYLQNIYTESDFKHQPLSLALNIAENTLWRRGACRVHGSGFSGTIQAFVPFDTIKEFKMNMERVFGSGSCRILSIRQVGGCEVVIS